MKYSDAYRPLSKNLVLCLMKSFQNTKPLTQVFFYFILSFRLAILPLLKKQNKIRHLEWIKYQAIKKAKVKIGLLNKNFHFFGTDDFSL